MPFKDWLYIIGAMAGLAVLIWKLLSNLLLKAHLLTKRWESFVTVEFLEARLNLCKTAEAAKIQELVDIVQSNSARAAVETTALRNEVIPMIEKVDDGLTRTLQATAKMHGQLQVFLKQQPTG